MSKRIDGYSIDSTEGIDDWKNQPKHEYTFRSLDEYAAEAEKHVPCWGCWSGDFQGAGLDIDKRWNQTAYSDPTELYALLIEYMREGWPAPVPECLEITDRAVQLVEREMNAFEPTHDITGAEVDVAAYLSGEPECMIQYPVQRVSNLGSLVTLVQDVQCSRNVRASSVFRRGQVLTALAITLERFGHQTELWISDEYVAHPKGGDMAGGLMYRSRAISGQPERIVIRCKVKGANDMIDPARIMMAFAHPGIQRGIGFTVAQDVKREGEYNFTDREGLQYGAPEARARTNGKSPGLGMALHAQSFGPVTHTSPTMPEGTIYIPPMFRENDAPNADIELRRYLVQLGFIEEKNFASR